ncbi:ABC transporter permease [Verrucomicrobiota bacterium]
MIRTVAGKYAFRSLFRNLRRTGLSALGAGIGCAIAVMGTSWVGGAGEMQMRAASESGAGHLRVVPLGWEDTRENTLRLTDPGHASAETAKLRGVKVAAARGRANGLLAFGNRTSGVEIVGVDPRAEHASNRIVHKSKLEGRYLQAGDSGKTVIGRGLAKRLDVELDDDLYVTMSGKDQITSLMLNIVGILETGSEDLDTSICHVMLDDVAKATGYEGPGEISLLLEDPELMRSLHTELAAALFGRNDVITWKEVSPELAANVDGDTAFTRILMGIIVVVVSLGIAGAQLTAVLERRREFAVLSALGMKDRQIVSLILVEAVLIGIGGAVVALAAGGSVAHLLATKGVNIAKMMGGEMSMGGVLLDPVMYGSFGLWIVWYALGISLVSTLAASIYPAWFATRTDPADALRVV